MPLKVTVSRPGGTGTTRATFLVYPVITPDKQRDETKPTPTTKWLITVLWNPDHFILGSGHRYAGRSTKPSSSAPGQAVWKDIDYKPKEQKTLMVIVNCVAKRKGPWPIIVTAISGKFCFNESWTIECGPGDALTKSNASGRSRTSRRPAKRGNART